MRRRIAVLLLKYSLGLGLLGWVVAAHWHLPSAGGEDVGIAAALTRPIHWLPLAAAGVLTVATVGLTVVRWYLLVRAQGLPFTLTNAFRLGLVGYALSTFLPGTVGGDLLKAVCIAREQRRRTAAAATVLFDRVVGVSGLYSLAAIVGLVCVATGGLADLVPDPWARTVIGTALAAAGVVLGGLVATWLLLRWLPETGSQWLLTRLERVPKLGRLLAELWRSARLYRTHGRIVAVAWVLSVANHCATALIAYCAAISLTPASEVPPVAAHFLIVPVSSTIQAGALTPGGIGAGEFVLGEFYEHLGSTLAAGVLAALVARMLGWSVGFAGYLMYLRMPSNPRDSLRSSRGLPPDS